jgi:Rieske Fe-S protein
MLARLSPNCNGRWASRAFAGIAGAFSCCGNIRPRHDHSSSRNSMQTRFEETALIEPTTIDKRFFLKCLLFLLTALAAALGAGGVGRFAFFGMGKSKPREVSKDVIGKLEPNAPVHIPEAHAWVMKRNDEEPLMAFDDRCTHLGCRQKWNPARELFECPCHGSEFDVAGNVKRGPATKPMPRLFVGDSDGEKLRLLDKPPATSRAS